MLEDKYVSLSAHTCRNNIGCEVHLGNYSGVGGLAGIDADFESRKYFMRLKAEFMRSTIAPDFDHVESRIGVAPYEAEYSDVASWFMMQAQWLSNLDKKFVMTPLASRIFQ